MRETRDRTEKEQCRMLQPKVINVQIDKMVTGNTEDTVSWAGCGHHRNMHQESLEHLVAKATPTHELQSSEVKGPGFDWWRSRWKSSVADWPVLNIWRSKLI